MNLKIRELAEIYGIENVLEWVGNEIDEDQHTSNLAIEILLLPEAKRRVSELKSQGKSLKNITFEEWLKWARKVKESKT
jgi:hypothetical protein